MKAKEDKRRSNKQTRLQIGMSVSEFANLDAMVQQVESVRSPRELINQALILFRLAVGQRKLGRDMCSMEIKDRSPIFYPVTMPVIDELAKSP